MGQAAEERRCPLCVTEHGWPFAEGEVGGNDDPGAFVETADQVEQQLAAGLREGQIAKFVEDDEVEAGHVIRQPSLLAATGLGLQPVHQINYVVEPTEGVISDERTGNCNDKVGLAGPGAANQDHAALLYHPGMCQARFSRS